MAPDVAVLWDVAAPALAARGLPLDHPPTAEALAALCLGLAMDCRLQARWVMASPADRAAIERLRPSLQKMARSCAWALGLLPIERISHVPRDARGQDVELWEWFAGLDRPALEAAVQAALPASAAIPRRCAAHARWRT
jgi:hypothetical protein